MLGQPEVGDYYRRSITGAMPRPRGGPPGRRDDDVGDTMYENVLVTEDFTTLEAGVLEHEGYAPEVGLIREGPPTGSGAHLTETGETEPTTSDPTTLCQP